MKRYLTVLAVLLVALCSLAEAQNRTYTIEDLLKVHRVGDPQISPDGKHVAFAIGGVLFDENRPFNQIYVMSIDGSGLKQLTSGDRSASAPRWAPDGKKIAYVHRGQIWVMDSDGEHKEQISKISSGGAAVWSPDGKWIAYVPIAENQFKNVNVVAVDGSANGSAA